MPSIILSFVGQQDPVSDSTQEEGSIVSLVRHLAAAQQPVRQVYLLYTHDTQERAELTQGWLADTPISLLTEAVELVPVDAALSADPVDLWSAVQSARRALEAAIVQCTGQDILELNASSGTPVMKSTWFILQAAGYAPKSRLWQVRNPTKQQPHQARVFQTNIQALRQEFDLKVIKQQLADYNYRGALATLKPSSLATPLLEALLKYGYCRLSLDFDQAKAALVPVANDIDDPRLQTEISALAQKNGPALLQEAYFNAVVELRNKQFSDFLVRVSQFQEKALKCFVQQQLVEGLSLPQSFEAATLFWAELPQMQPDLYRFLAQYCFRDDLLKLEGFLNRPHLVAILEYGQSPVLQLLQMLTKYCDQRNRYIHQFEGISTLDGVDNVLQGMRQVLTQLGLADFTNPFNRLNQIILNSLISNQQPSVRCAGSKIGRRWG